MTNRPPRVWLLQEPRRFVEVEDARNYGTIHPVLPADLNPSLTPGPALRTMVRTLAEYEPGDFLVYAPADPIVPLLAGLALHATGGTREPLRWMRWERRRPPAGLPPEEREAAARRAGIYVPTFIDCRPLFGFNNDTKETAE